MKLVMYMILFGGLALGSQATDDFERKIKIAAANATEENVISLLEEIDGNCRYEYALSEEMLNLNEEAKKVLIGIPDLARAFSDQMEKSRLKYTVEEIEGNRAEEFEKGVGGFSFLFYVKTPETVTVLGRYLYDVRVDLKDGQVNPRYHDVRPTFAAMSAEMLRKMGIREFPVKKYSEHFAEDPLAPVKYLMVPIEKSQAWWEEVKSGKRALSFVGEDVEYRFKPDGSWEKFPYTGPPDPPKVKEESKVKWDSEISKPVPVKQDWKKHWPWLAGAVALLVAVVVWFRRTARTV